MQDLTKHISALEGLLKEKALIDDETFSDYEKLVTEDWLPNNGARLIAKAWLDTNFKEFLMADGKAAASSLGFGMPEHHGSLVVKENTSQIHNVICCTLCSCTKNCASLTNYARSVFKIFIPARRHANNGKSGA